MMTAYILGIGSNLDPYKNIPAILTALFELTDELTVSRIIETQPSGFESQYQFLNIAILMNSELATDALKQKFNAIEARLGRDRQDPLSSKKDRPADVDILLELTANKHIDSHQLPPEKYLRPLVIEMLQDIGVKTGEAPDFANFQTISLPFGPGHIGHGTIVIKQVDDTFRLEPLHGT